LRLAEIFAREVLRLLVGKGLLSPEWAERILSWRHTGFNVHSRRARTRTEAERIGKYMVRPILALDRLSFLEREGRIGYRHGDDGAELERMDYLELIARVTSHIPDKGQVMVRYYGLYANARIHPSPGVDVRRGETAAGPRVLDSRPRPGYSLFMRGRVASDSATSDLTPSAIRKFL
jgi:hypothetical protein